MRVQEILGINSSNKDAEFIFICALDCLAFGTQRLDFEELKKEARQATDQNIYYCWLAPLLNMINLDTRISKIIPETHRDSENICDKYLSVLSDKGCFDELVEEAEKSMQMLESKVNYYAFDEKVYERLLDTVDVKEACQRVREKFDSMMSSGYSSYHFIYNSFFFKRAVASKIKNMLSTGNRGSQEVDMYQLRDKMNKAIRYFDSSSYNETIEINSYSLLTNLSMKIETAFRSKGTPGDLHTMVYSDMKTGTYFDKNTGREHKIDEFQVIDKDFLENGRNEELDLKDKFINKLYHESNITAARSELRDYIPVTNADLKYYSIVSNLTSEVECQDLVDKLDQYAKSLYGRKDSRKVGLLNTAVYKDFGLVSGRLTDSKVRRKMVMIYNNMMIMNTSNMPFIWDAAFSEINRDAQSDDTTRSRDFFSYLDMSNRPSDSEIGHVKSMVNHYSNSWFYGYKTNTGFKHRDWFLNTEYDLKTNEDDFKGYARSCIVSTELKGKGTKKIDLFVDDFLKSSFDLAVPCSNKPSIETMIPVPMLGTEGPVSTTIDGDRSSFMKRVYNGFCSYNTLSEFYRLTGQEFLENNDPTGETSKDVLNVKGVHDSAEGRLTVKSETEVEDISAYRIMETLTLPNYSQNLAKMCKLPDTNDFKINKVIQDLNTANAEKFSKIQISDDGARKSSIIQSIDTVSQSTFETVFSPWDILCVPMTRASAVMQGYVMIRMAPWRLYRIYRTANGKKYNDVKSLLEPENQLEPGNKLEVSRKITGTYYQHVFMRHNGDPGYSSPRVSFNRFMGNDVESSDSNALRNPDFFDLRMVDIFKSDDFLHVLEYVYVNTLPSIISLSNNTEIKSLENENSFIMDNNVRMGAKLALTVLKNYFSKEIGERKFELLTKEEIEAKEALYNENDRGRVRRLLRQFSVQMGLLLGKLVLYTYDLVELCNCLGEFVLGLYGGLSQEYLDKLLYSPNLTDLSKLRAHGLFCSKENSKYYEGNVEEESFAKDELELIQRVVVEVLNKADRVDVSKVSESTSIKLSDDDDDNTSSFYAAYLWSCVVGRFYYVIREIAFDSYLLTKYHISTMENLNPLVCRMAFYCSYRTNYVRKLSRLIREYLSYFSQLQNSLSENFLTKIAEELSLNLNLTERLSSINLLNTDSLASNKRWLAISKVSDMDIIAGLKRYCEVFDTLLKEVECTLVQGIRKPVKNVPSVGTSDINKAISEEHIGIWGGNSIEELKKGVKRSGVYKSFRFNETSGLAETEDGIPFCVYGPREKSSSELVYYVLHKCGLYLKIDPLDNTITPVDTTQAVYTLGGKNLLSTMERKNINDSRKVSAYAEVMFDGKEFGNIQVNSSEIELINSKELLIDVLTETQEKISKQLPDSWKESFETTMLEDKGSDKVVYGLEQSIEKEARKNELAIRNESATSVGLYTANANDLKKDWEQAKNAVGIIAQLNEVGGNKLLSKCATGASREEISSLLDEVVSESVSTDSPTYELDVQDAFINRATELAKNSGSSIVGTKSVSTGDLDVQVRAVPNLRQ